MSLPKTILVPTDFGAGSEAAMSYAVELAKAVGAEVVIMHAFEIPMMSFPDGNLVATPDVASRILDGANEGLAEAVRAHAAEGVPVRGVVKQGESSQAICEVVREVGAELVVMATHGRRGLQHALLGSVAEKVVR